MNYRSPIFSVLGIAALLLGRESLHATTFNIASGDVAGLKAALTTSNSNNLDDIINLTAGGFYPLGTVDNTTDGDNALPVILSDNSHALTINGNGATIQRNSGAPGFRLFRVNCSAGCTSKQTILNNLTITGGAAVKSGVTGGESGGAIYFNNGNLTLNSCVLTGNLASFRGGAISAGGSLTLNSCTLSDNQGDDGGGAIANGNGTLVANSCTFSGNKTVAGPGGAVHNFDGGSQAVASFTNCTFDNNTRNPNGGTTGGGIFNNTLQGPIGASAQLTLTHCTIRQTDVLNSGTWTGGPPPLCTLTVRNNIFSESTLINSTNPGHDRVQIQSSGYNLSSGSGGGNLIGPGDQINTDPKLDPAGLQNNGGVTATIGLLDSSPALDRGNSFGVSSDQRGQVRPRDLAFVPNGAGSDGADVGAFEAIDPKQGGPIFIVNTVADHEDGVCGPVDCSLRDAIAAANAASDLNTVTFAGNVTGTITLNSTLAQLIISSPITITGPGARTLAVSGGSTIRVFNFSSGPSVLSGLTIRDGAVVGPVPFFAAGGGLANYGSLTVNDCTFTGNRATGGSNTSPGGGGSNALGGGIYNFFGGGLTFNRCTFSNNNAVGGRGGNNSGASTAGGNGGAAEGGAVFNDSGCTMNLANCTFANNTATGGAGGDDPTSFGGNGGAGAGAAVLNRGTITVTSSTIRNNTGLGGFGGVGTPRGGTSGVGSGGLTNFGADTAFTIRNTLSADNTGNDGPDVKGAFVSQGYNLIGKNDGSSGFVGAGDQSGTNAAPLNAQLGALANNGGPTDTMLLLTNSPAIDRGYRFGLTIDQRGLPRPLDFAAYANAPGGDGSDIGAVEVDLPQAGPTFIVTTIADFDDGLCGVNHCSLREAIAAANAAPGGNTISFAPGVTGTIQLGAALPTVSGNLALQGPGANLVTVRRDTGGDYRIFTITNGSSTGPVVSLTGLTIDNGKAPTPAPINGGGILNDHGDLTLANCVVSGNVATNGAGIYSNGATSGAAKLTMTGCTLSNNVASGFGGAVNNNGSQGGNAMSLLTNCTVHGNDASRGAAVWTGGASGSASLSLFNCTIADNSAPFGGIYNDGTSGSGVVTLRSTILKTGAMGANIANVNNAGTVTSQGYNLSSDSGSNFLTATGDLINTDPQLSTLTSNGGPAPTRLLLAGSPALDKGKSFGLTIDQRGFARVADTAHTSNAAGGDGADIGAVEINPIGSLVDSDNDGMPDEFEVFYGINDPNADADGDGRTNLQEFQEGTDPTNSSSFRLRVIAIARSGNDIVITFNGVAGKTFQLDRKGVLTENTWTALSGPGATITPGTTANAQLTHVGGATSGIGFYRVRLTP